MEGATASLSSETAMYSITDLIPLEKLQLIQDAFARGNNVASTLTDIDGHPITTVSNHSMVCKMIRATEKGRQNCIMSGKELGLKARDNKVPLRHSCSSIGFSDAAAPILVNGRHIANWLIGQYHVGDVDESRVREYALEIGADPAAMVEAFRDMPKHSAERFDAKLEFLGIMANELSNMGYQSLLERQQRAELQEVRDQLQTHQLHLESLVAERTRDVQKVNQRLLDEIEVREEAQQRQNRLITAIESAVESIVITGTDGEIIYCNPAFSRLTGYSLEECRGLNPRVLKSGRHDDEFYRSLWQTISSGKVWAGRMINRKKDGSLYQEEATIAPVLDREGRILNYVAVKRDITKEVELEAQLRQAQRLESLGTLAAGLAHEINTPIQFILNNINYVKESLADLLKLLESYEQLAQAATAAAVFSEERGMIAKTAEEIEVEYHKKETALALEESIAGINKIATIVRAMKDFSQPLGTEKRREDLNEIIHQAVTLSRSGWQEVAELELHLDTAMPEIPLYGGKIKQMLLDMLANSSYALIQKFGHQPEEKGKIVIGSRYLGKQIELTIADSGCGIAADHIEKIFDPFFTTKPVGQGRGQGLSAVHGIVVDTHGGSISALSTLGEGTVFTILLPTA